MAFSDPLVLTKVNDLDLRDASIPKPRKVASTNLAGFKEYSELALETGFVGPVLLIETFKQFLNENDIPVFNLQEVINYMDAKALAESKDKCGWEWKPLREQDHMNSIKFGRKAERKWVGTSRTAPDGYVNTIAASDFYEGPHPYTVWEPFGGGSAHGTSGIGGGGGGINSLTAAIHQQMTTIGIGGSSSTQPGRYVECMSTSPNKIYDYPIPLHALKKVALIHKKFGEDVGLFVSDYALAPAIQYPDPFLMAVIPNTHIAKGEGRFIIDFWNEPGFGLTQQLA